MKLSIKNKAGFTLIEIILYIALVSIFISGAIHFAWDIVYARAKSGVEREVNENLRIASDRISYEIRNASAINSISSSSLCLGSSDATYNPILIYLSSGQVHLGWGGGSVNCTSLTNDVLLTSNNVTVSNLTFTSYSSAPATYNVAFSFTVDSTGTRSEWQKSQTYRSTVEMRSRL